MTKSIALPLGKCCRKRTEDRQTDKKRVNCFPPEGGLLPRGDPSRAWTKRGGGSLGFPTGLGGGRGARPQCGAAGLGRPLLSASLCFLPQVTGIPMNCSVKLQLSLYMKAIRGIG